MQAERTPVYRLIQDQVPHRQPDTLWANPVLHLLIHEMPLKVVRETEEMGVKGSPRGSESLR